MKCFLAIPIYTEFDIDKYSMKGISMGIAPVLYYIVYSFPAFNGNSLYGLEIVRNWNMVFLHIMFHLGDISCFKV